MGSLDISLTNKTLYVLFGFKIFQSITTVNLAYLKFDQWHLSAKPNQRSITISNQTEINKKIPHKFQEIHNTFMYTLPKKHIQIYVCEVK